MHLDFGFKPVLNNVILQDLHYAYGNYAFFLRHLILLEKYWRNGDLILSDNASQKASGYIR